MAREKNEYMMYGGTQNTVQSTTLRARPAPGNASGTWVAPMIP